MYNYNIYPACKFSIKSVLKKTVKYRITYKNKKYIIEIYYKTNIINKLRIRYRLRKYQKEYKIKRKIKLIWRKYHEGN